MSYHLGVDLGTSYTAAAVSRDGVLEMVSLGTHSLEIPSVVYLDAAGTLLVGEVAERRGASDPARLSREFKRRLGDPAPILVAGTPFSAEALMAAVLRAVVVDVTARQGEPPDHLTLTRPANWGGYKRESFSQVPALADVNVPWSEATEPEAAAVHFASTNRVASGVVAVYDLGGGTFDAAVLRKSDDGFTVLGAPEGIEHLGGADFDDAVFEYVRRMLGERLAEIDPTDPAVRAAAARLRVECVLAKESLSRDTEATIPVALPGLQTEVRLTRNDFEGLVRPSLMATVDCLRRAVRMSGVPVDQIAATVLAGGSSRIPLTAELITGELELPVAMGTHPKHTVALGAALLAQHRSANPVVEEPTGRFDRAIISTGATAAIAGPATGPGPTAAGGPPSGPVAPPSRSDDRPGGRRRPLLVVGAVAAVVVILIATLLILQPWTGTAGSPQAGSNTTSAAASPPTPPPSSSAGPTESSPTPTTASTASTSESAKSAGSTTGPTTQPTTPDQPTPTVTSTRAPRTTISRTPTDPPTSTGPSPTGPSISDPNLPPTLENASPECNAVYQATLLFTAPIFDATAITQRRIDQAFVNVADAPAEIQEDLALLRTAAAKMLGKSGQAALAPIFEDPVTNAALQNANALLATTCGSATG